MKLNPMHQIDFYKTGHIFQYEPGTTEVYSNFTARSDRLAPVLRSGPGAFDGKVVFFGLQGFIKEFLIETFNEGFFGIPKDRAVSAYKRRMDTSLGPGVVTVDHIASLHDLGFLPIEIKALPEGSKVGMKVPLFTVKNTLPGFFWLTNYLEDILSNMNWKSITVATIAHQYRRLLDSFTELTGAPKEGVQWQVHDFSSRGMSGPEDSSRTSAGHLLSFTGSDAVGSIDYVEAYYGANADVEMIGGGVPATEHSVVSMGGKASEEETFLRLIKDVYPSGIVSYVSDTWDFWDVITGFTVRHYDAIVSRVPNALGQAKVVFRPDSGNPIHILCGYTDSELEAGVYGPQEFVGANGEVLYRVKEGQEIDVLNRTQVVGKMITAAERKGAVQCLWDVFGGAETAKGYKMLHDRVGLIYGDSITLARAQEILQRLADKGFASSNIVLGAGSYSYQYVSRDSFGMAMKATSGVVNGERREVAKDPKTDSGTKKSAVGLLRVEKEGADFVLYDRQTPEQAAGGALELVFKDGQLIREDNLAGIRARLAAQG